MSKLEILSLCDAVGPLQVSICGRLEVRLISCDHNTDDKEQLVHICENEGSIRPSERELTASSDCTIYPTRHIHKEQQTHSDVNTEKHSGSVQITGHKHYLHN